MTADYPYNRQIKEAQEMAIRIEALKAATATIFEGNPEHYGEDIITLAKRFEKYLGSGE